MADNLVPLFATDLPVVLLGHSVGGLMVIDYGLGRHRRPDLVVLNAPALDVVVPAWKRKTAPLLARIAPGLTLGNPIEPSSIFIDQSVADDFRNDPLVVKRTTARLGGFLVERMEHVERSLELYDLPTLVVHGGADTLVPPEISEPLGRLPNVERRVYPALRHESINEPKGRGMLEDIVTWIRSQATPAS